LDDGAVGYRGLICEVVEPFFSIAAAPHIHPFVIPSAESAAVQDQSILTPSILFDRLANAGRLNQGSAGEIRQSTG